MSIETNVKVGQLAKEAMSLALDLCRESGLELEEMRRFWLRLHESTAQLLNEPQQVERPHRADAMTNDEAKVFERTCMPFGAYKDKPIGDVPLGYLDWLVGEPDFKRDVRRYLANPVVKQALSEELE